MNRVGAARDCRPILVVDDVQDVADLRAFMNAAKLYADMHMMKIVLVISTGEAARRMLDYSSKSRATVCKFILFIFKFWLAA